MWNPPIALSPEEQKIVARTQKARKFWQVSCPREQFFEFMFLPFKVEVKYQPKTRRNGPP